jgi:hypothetical protein
MSKKLFLQLLVASAFTRVQIQATFTLQLINACPFTIYSVNNSSNPKVQSNAPQSILTSQRFISKSPNLTGPLNSSTGIQSNVDITGKSYPHRSSNALTLNDPSKLTILIQEIDGAGNNANTYQQTLQNNVVLTLYIKPSSTPSGLMISTTP